MSIGVGTGDYAEYNAVVTPPGGGPALLFIRDNNGRYYALLASDSVTWETREVGGGSGFTVLLSWADDADNVFDVSAIAGTGEIFVAESTDGAVTPLTVTPGDTIASGVFGRILFRNSEFGMMAFGDDTTGGLYTSTDGLTWTRVAIFPIFYAGPIWRSHDYWGRTDTHIYWLSSDRGFTDPPHSLQVDSPVGSASVWSFQYSGPTINVLDTFQIGLDPIPSPPTQPTISMTSATADIPWDATDVRVKAELEDTFAPDGGNVTPFEGLSVSVSGDTISGMTVTVPFDGDVEMGTFNNQFPGDDPILPTELSAGSTGVKTYGTLIHPQELYSAFSGDVVLAVFIDTNDNSVILEQYVGTSAVVVTPGFAAPIDDKIDSLRSADGSTWVGSFNNGTTFQKQLMVSHDGGSTWALVGPTSDFDIRGITFDPVVANKWWALIGVAAPGYDIEFKLYTSTDDGDTWTDFGADSIFLAFGGDPQETQIVPLGGKTN